MILLNRGRLCEPLAVLSRRSSSGRRSSASGASLSLPGLSAWAGCRAASMKPRRASGLGGEAGKARAPGRPLFVWIPFESSRADANASLRVRILSPERDRDTGHRAVQSLTAPDSGYLQRHSLGGGGTLPSVA
jgi:hypothetical protein